MHRKQFLFTRNKANFPDPEEIRRIGEYYLYLGKDSEYSFTRNENAEVHLLGSMYDWENPQFSNEQILENISHNQSLDEIIRASDRYFGEFVIIVKLHDEIYIFNDATGQKEVYYNNEFTSFGTQPKLLGLSETLSEHNRLDAKEYYDSPAFRKKCLFVGNTTHKENIFHLMPNHFLDIRQKKTHRFFPAGILETKSLEYVSRISSEMLKGYITAVSKRNRIKMAVTGGYDSRVLFLASLDVECEYYVSKHHYMDDLHHDILIPKRLTSHYQKNFIVEDDKIISEINENPDYINDIDFPRYSDSAYNRGEYTYINGNISEIARNYYGCHRNATAEDLCFLSGNSAMSFVINEYGTWLKNKPLFEKDGYHYLDMFYWEEKMGNWAAKSKTEAHALGRDILSPFNSRELLMLLLSTERKYRDSHFNRLYDMIINELSGKDKEILKTAVNPGTKQSIIRIMKLLRIYNLYRFIGVKTRILNI